MDRDIEIKKLLVVSIMPRPNCLVTKTTMNSSIDEK